MAKSVICGMLFILISGKAMAGVCDYKPSAMIGEAGAGVVAGVGGTASVAGTAAQAAGIYVITNGTTGAIMLGSTAAGVSGAGTVGIIGGTAGVIGAAGALIMSPAVIIGGGLAAVGTGAYEGACLFAVERVTEYDDVLAIVEASVAQADHDQVAMETTEEGLRALVVADGDHQGVYLVNDLYIADGLMMHRDWFKNTQIPLSTFASAD